MNEIQAVQVKANDSKTFKSLRSSRYQDPLLSKQVLNVTTVIYA